MWEFLFGMAAGSALSGKSKNTVSRERLYEHVQTGMLIDIVLAADKIEKTDPTPSMLKLQLKPLKSMFDAIDYSGIKSADGKTVYQQVKDYFAENDL